MKIKFIGTGGSEGTPAIFCRCEVCEYARTHQGKYVRTRAGLMIDDELLIDFSPDLYMNSIKFNIYLSKIRGFYHDTDIIKVITGIPFFSACFLLIKFPP